MAKMVEKIFWIFSIIYIPIVIYRIIHRSSTKLKLNNKNPSYSIQKIFTFEVIDDDVFQRESFIIINSEGRTLKAPIFSNKEKAIDWLNTHYPVSINKHYKAF